MPTFPLPRTAAPLGRRHPPDRRRHGGLRDHLGPQPRVRRERWLHGIDALPLTGRYTTFALDKDIGKPKYVTDSAASGSGWATGTKTYDGAISVDLEGIDKRDHAADACGRIGETVAFDAAVKVALDFAKSDGNTSVFVTADHGHTSQIVYDGRPPRPDRGCRPPTMLR